MVTKGLMVLAGDVVWAASWLQFSAFIMSLYMIMFQTSKPHLQFGSAVLVYAEAFHLVLSAVIKATVNSPVPV